MTDRLTEKEIEKMSWVDRSARNKRIEESLRRILAGKPLKRFESENEFVKFMMPLILGGLIPDRTKVKCFAEVPRYSHNDHYDIILIDYKNFECLNIEFKLKDYKAVKRQIDYSKISAIAIVNYHPDFDKIKPSNIYTYTGYDLQLDVLIEHIVCRGWARMDVDTVNIYYWAYRNDESNFDGGHKSCKRLSFFHVYKKAVNNLLEYYGNNMDFYQIYRILGFYSISQANKHYRSVIRERKQPTL